jgi:hypothetical protein
MLAVVGGYFAQWARMFDFIEYQILHNIPIFKLFFDKYSVRWLLNKYAILSSGSSCWFRMKKTRLMIDRAWSGMVRDFCFG